MTVATSATQAMGTAGGGGPEKAMFVVDPDFTSKFPVGKPPAQTLQCQYNPGELSISGGGTWKKDDANQSHKLPDSPFVEPNPRSMSVKLMFDRYPDGDVEGELATLFDWTQPRRSALPVKGKASAPWLRFHWGRKHYFKCCIEKLTISITLFLSTGSAARATADLTLKELPDVLPLTNPTSGGDGGEGRHSVLAGDTLHSIAHQHYGQPRLWRGLAAFNGVDDPMRLATGTTLSLPAPEIVEELS